MDDFSFFFNQGLRHISDLAAYDHILFIVALAALYSLKNWKNLLFLVTAFTIGHSIALAFAILEWVKPNSEIIEFLIPTSIVLTCIWNIIKVRRQEKAFHVEQSFFHYGIVVLFGLIHGLGFSSYLRFILSSEESIFIPLLSFNIGLEVGQIFILTIALIINFVFLELNKIPYKFWSILVSTLIFLISIPILLETGKALFLDS